jgi:hypothetical protein
VGLAVSTGAGFAETVTAAAETIAANAEGVGVLGVGAVVAEAAARFGNRGADSPRPPSGVAFFGGMIVSRR